MTKVPSCVYIVVAEVEDISSDVVGEGGSSGAPVQQQGDWPRLPLYHRDGREDYQ